MISTPGNFNYDNCSSQRVWCPEQICSNRVSPRFDPSVLPTTVTKKWPQHQHDYKSIQKWPAPAGNRSRYPWILTSGGPTTRLFRDRNKPRNWGKHQGRKWWVTQKLKTTSSQNWVCPVWKLFPHVGRVMIFIVSRAQWRPYMAKSKKFETISNLINKNKQHRFLSEWGVCPNGIFYPCAWWDGGWRSLELLRPPPPSSPPSKSAQKVVV